jgi:hypothetical protein
MPQNFNLQGMEISKAPAFPDACRMEIPRHSRLESLRYKLRDGRVFRLP